MPEGMPRGRVLQDAWHLVCFSIIALVVAVGLNWRNDVRGWWINLAIISAVEMGFILFVLIPGYIPLWPGLAGPLFWILGLILSSMALWRGRIRYDSALSNAGTERRRDRPHIRQV